MPAKTAAPPPDPAPAVRDYPYTQAMPSGNTVTVRDWHELRRGDKRTVQAAIQPGNGLTSNYDLTDGLATLLVTAWSYPGLPIPKVTAGSLALLPPEDDAALVELVAPARRALFPTPAETKEEQARQGADPQSPTTGDAG